MTRTPSALPYMSTLAELEVLESVDQYLHRDLAREQRAEYVRGDVIRYPLLKTPSFQPDHFLLHVPSLQRLRYRNFALWPTKDISTQMMMESSHSCGN